MNRIILSGIGALSMLVATVESCEAIFFPPIITDGVIECWKQLSLGELATVTQLREKAKGAGKNVQTLVLAMDRDLKRKDDQIKARQDKIKELLDQFRRQDDKITSLQAELEELASLKAQLDARRGGLEKQLPPNEKKLEDEAFSKRAAINDQVLSSFGGFYLSDQGDFYLSDQILSSLGSFCWGYTNCEVNLVGYLTETGAAANGVASSCANMKTGGFGTVVAFSFTPGQDVLRAVNGAELLAYINGVLGLTRAGIPLLTNVPSGRSVLDLGTSVATTVGLIHVDDSLIDIVTIANVEYRWNGSVWA
ncbi:MAG: hypothetical protein LBR89_01445 [Holosporales bacterium]|nr:hypothetical protein [Holosporales bacterium]